MPRDNMPQDNMPRDDMPWDNMPWRHPGDNIPQRHYAPETWYPEMKCPGDDMPMLWYALETISPRDNLPQETICPGDDMPSETTCQTCNKPESFKNLKLRYWLRKDSSETPEMIPTCAGWYWRDVVTGRKASITRVLETVQRKAGVSNPAQFSNNYRSIGKNI